MLGGAIMYSRGKALYLLGRRRNNRPFIAILKDSE